MRLQLHRRPRRPSIGVNRPAHRRRLLVKPGRPLPYLTNPDRLIYRPFVSLRAAATQRPATQRWVDLHLDTGGDCILIRQHYANQLGLVRPREGSDFPLRTAAGTFSPWFAEVTLTLGPVDSPQPFCMDRSGWLRPGRQSSPERAFGRSGSWRRARALPPRRTGTVPKWDRDAGRP